MLARAAMMQNDATVLLHRRSRLNEIEQRSVSNKNDGEEDTMSLLVTSRRRKYQKDTSIVVARVLSK
ncbi:hypothetical protein ANTQUA_LOCUS8743 [Anthophora quadrimaculata]